jgi:hypothetical protein
MGARLTTASRRSRSAFEGGASGGVRQKRRLAAPLALAGIAASVFASSPARSESVLNDKPAPDSVAEMHGPFQEAFQLRVREKTLFPRLKRALQNLPPFLRDTTISLRSRSYYLHRRDEGDDIAEAWAIGGGLWVESGWFEDVFAVGGELFTSQKLIGKKSRDGTDLLKTGQRSYTVFGQAYAMLRYRDHLFTAYRQELNLPYVNKNDSRMTPATFEGYTLRGSISAIPKLEKLEYLGGYLTQMKRRDEDRFIHMSEAAGVPGTSRHGMAFGGLMITPVKDFVFGAIDYYVEDTINIAYAKVDYLYWPTDELGVRFQGQFSHQRSVGNDALTGSSFRTWIVGGRVAASYRSGILALGFSTTDGGAQIVSPFGGNPSFLSIMQRDFDRAGEDAWIAGLTYDFERLGFEGLSAFANYAEGYGARDADTGESLPDRREFDVTLDYRVKKGLLRGFWLRLRASVLDVDGEEKTSNEFRAIINYDIPVL